MIGDRPKFIPVCEPTSAGEELDNVVSAVRSGWISSSGEFLQRFEAEFPTCVEAKHGVATCNGTAAIHLALAAAGIGPGDEVIMPSFTMVASANAVTYCGAIPRFVDADPETWTMDVTQLERARTSRTKAVMTVTIYGHPTDFDPVGVFCKKHGLFWLEDGAEAHGSRYRGRHVASYPDATTFSFYANKIISTGEGGMVCTNDSAYADRCRVLRNLGFKLNGPRDYVHDVIGFNYRMTNLQAAIGCAQLRKFGEFVEMRRQNAARYNDRLSEAAEFIQLPVERSWATNCYWMYGVVLSDACQLSRDEVTSKLREQGIDTRPFFHPMHRQPIFESTYSLPISERLGQRGFYLPSSSHLSEGEIDYIAGTLVKLLTSG
jgi:perosamine synthetase